MDKDVGPKTVQPALVQYLVEKGQVDNDLSPKTVQLLCSTLWKKARWAKIQAQRLFSSCAEYFVEKCQVDKNSSPLVAFDHGWGYHQRARIDGQQHRSAS